MTVSFDTLSFAKRLTEAGEKPAVAEAHAMALKEFVMETIATKADIRELSRSFGEEIGDVRDEIQDLRAEIGNVRGELNGFREEVRQEFGAVRGETRTFREEVRQEFMSLRKEFEECFVTKDELRHEIGLLRKDVDAMGLKLTVRMGGMLAIAVGAVATLGRVL
jgi:predicted RNase H-like nuclease (RuvC/YqgF family)